MKSSLDILPALFMIAVSVITVLGVSELHYWSGYSPGPAFTPYWIVAAALVLSILIIVQTILSKSCNKPEWPERSGIFRILLTSLSLVLILILTPFLGMIITITLFSLFLLLGILRRPLIPSLFTTFITIALIYGVFVFWLQMSLPTGPFGI
jgi:hypothetical protein